MGCNALDASDLTVFTNDFDQLVVRVSCVMSISTGHFPPALWRNALRVQSMATSLPARITAFPRPSERTVRSLQAQQSADGSDRSGMAVPWTPDVALSENPFHVAV